MRVHQIRLDTQTVSGAFPLTFLDGMTNVYRNVQNVIVRIGPVVESAHSLLVNCHYDTVPDSPGTSKSKSTNDIIYSSKLSAGSSSKKNNNDSLLAPTYIFAVLIALFLLIYGFVMLIEKQLPQPLLLKNEAKYPGRFIAERAYNHLVNLTSLELQENLEEERLSLNAIYSSLSLMLTYIGSVMIPVMWLFSLSIFTVLREKTRLRANAPGILLNFFLFTTVPFLLCSYLIYCVYLLIIPIMGRSGSGNHAEEVVAFITTTIFSLLFNLLAPLILYVRSPKKILSLLSTGFLISVLLLVLTPLGFPYSGEISSPTPQRYMVMHVDRVYFSKENTVRERKSGLWLIDLDVNSPKTIENLLGDGLRLVNEETECSRELYCGLPYYLPVYSFIFQTHWIEDRTYTPLDVPLDLKLTYKHVEYSDGKKQTSDGRKPYSDEKSDADANNPSVGRERNATTAETESLNDEKADATRHSPARNATKGTTIKLSFALNGTDHVNIIASPYPGVELVRWSFLDGPPLKSKSQFRGRDTYYVFSTCASNLQTYHFWMEFFVPEKAFVDFGKAFDSVGGGKGGQADDRIYGGDIVDMAVAAHHVHGEKQMTKPLAAFFNKLPEWTVSTGWRLDFAWNKNGYVYHTRLDTTAQIPLATLQRTGDNILPLLLNLVNSKQLIAVHEYSEGSLIYFDFVGIFFVCITSTNTVLMCLTTLSIVLVGVYINAGSVRDALKTGYGRVLLRVIAFIIVNYLLCLLVNLAIAFALTKVNRAMAWYGSHIWLLFLYVIPTLVTSCVNILYFSHRHLSGFLLSRRVTEPSCFTPG
ncbi:endoplasmic reticulum metallopeptidase 1-like [Diaphorina citri]|uniref:Endoplasmic reticulum metallopeptidase 1-like n=1 Tax=Diaphorina citri TaxID=121845 RepID=A0A3Q0IYB4_DIACI|nr:endoplasmic reticulum metallopeptidase 1-like [Diaphorina citri]